MRARDTTGAILTSTRTPRESVPWRRVLNAEPETNKSAELENPTYSHRPETKFRFINPLIPLRALLRTEIEHGTRTQEPQDSADQGRHVCIPHACGGEIVGWEQEDLCQSLQNENDPAVRDEMVGGKDQMMLNALTKKTYNMMGLIIMGKGLRKFVKKLSPLSYDLS